MGNSSAAGVSPDIFRQIRACTSPGMEPEVIEKILRGYFSGKRDAIRTSKFLDVQVKGKRGSFHAMAVDISRTGILLRIVDSDFATPDEANHLMPYTARVWYHFEGGLTVSFPEVEVVAKADVVRVTGYCGRGNSLILIGCRFRTAIDEKSCDAIGIEHAADRPPGE